MVDGGADGRTAMNYRLISKVQGLPFQRLRCGWTVVLCDAPMPQRDALPLMVLTPAGAV